MGFDNLVTNIGCSKVTDSRSKISLSTIFNPLVIIFDFVRSFNELEVVFGFLIVTNFRPPFLMLCQCFSKKLLVFFSFSRVSYLFREVSSK